MYAFLSTGRLNRVAEFPCKLEKNEKVMAIGTEKEMLRLQILLSVPPISSNAFVYLMRDERTSYTKIGFSKNVHYRERTLQADNPLISLIEYWPGDVAHERTLHKHFEPHRVRGEWFDLSAAQIERAREYMEQVSCKQMEYLGLREEWEWMQKRCATWKKEAQELQALLNKRLIDVDF